MRKIEKNNRRLNKDTHNCVIDSEIERVSWCCEAKNVLQDIKFFMKENYIGFFDESGENLDVMFNNGQRFRISVCELK